MSRWHRRLAFGAGGFFLLVFLTAASIVFHDPGDPPDAPWARWVMAAAAVAFLVTAFLAATLTDRARDDLRLHLFRVLEMAARRGYPLGQALTAVGHDFEGPRVRRVHRAIELLDRGLPLSAALEQGAPGIVPPHAVDAIRAAEGDGRLAEALEALARESLAAPLVRTRFHLALLYPAVLLVFGAGIGYLATWECLRVRETRSMEVRYQEAIGLGADVSALSAWAAAALAASLAAARLLRWDRLRRRLRLRLDPVAIRLPFVGAAVEMAAAERVCRALAPLVRAGVPMDRALDRAGPASGNLSVEREASAAAAAVRGGISAHEAILGMGLLPRLVRARAAAACGGAPDRLASALEALAAECNERRRHREATLVASVYPVSIVLCGVLALLQFRGVMAFSEGARELYRVGAMPW